MNLIYKASQDGFEASSFHIKCDNKPNYWLLLNQKMEMWGYTEQS